MKLAVETLSGPPPTVLLARPRPGERASYLDALVARAPCQHPRLATTILLLAELGPALSPTMALRGYNRISLTEMEDFEDFTG
ncbi:hypothetical protein RRG08_049856 [Elysia crispata]|uniref:Uncharacterized protein n=1 Tax=Elysia crispata TaxID=231223 RepID=A0AAE0ZW12_9GAST|nr:hypothetical protein RRG08_049856 [Elysia crispata]